MMPLNLCSLAAYVRRQSSGLDFKVLDSERMSLNVTEIVEEVKLYCPDLIGITSNTCVFDVVKNITGLIKKEAPQIPIALGGAHVSALPERALVESGADFAVMGEGEMTLSEVVKKLELGRTDWSNIKGLAYLKDGRPVVNPPATLIQDLDILPFPARDLIDNKCYSAAPTKRVSLGPITLISTGRGCPYDCGFCAQRAIWGRKNRMRSPDSVVAEIEECVSRYDIHSFNITDELFTSDLERVAAISGLIRKRKLRVRWVCSARPERLDLETFKTMYAAGCREVSFGVESGSQKILERINKNTNLDEIRRVIGNAKKAGITTHASYIFGYIGEDDNTIRETIRFAKKLNTHVAAFFIASPLPGSRLYKEAMEKKYIDPGSAWANYSPLSNMKSVMSLPGLSSEKIRMWHRKAMTDYYLRPRYILLKIFSIRHLYDVANIFAGIKMLFGLRK